MPADVRSGVVVLLGIIGLILGSMIDESWLPSLLSNPLTVPIGIVIAIVSMSLVLFRVFR